MELEISKPSPNRTRSNGSTACAGRAICPPPGCSTCRSLNRGAPPSRSCRRRMISRASRAARRASATTCLSGGDLRGFASPPRSMFGRRGSRSAGPRRARLALRPLSSVIALPRAQGKSFRCALADQRVGIDIRSPTVEKSPQSPPRTRGRAPSRRGPGRARSPVPMHLGGEGGLRQGLGRGAETRALELALRFASKRGDEAVKARPSRDPAHEAFAIEIGFSPLGLGRGVEAIALIRDRSRAPP